MKSPSPTRFVVYNIVPTCDVCGTPLGTRDRVTCDAHRDRPESQRDRLGEGIAAARRKNADKVRHWRSGNRGRSAGLNRRSYLRRCLRDERVHAVVVAWPVVRFFLVRESKVPETLTDINGVAHALEIFAEADGTLLKGLDVYLYQAVELSGDVWLLQQLDDRYGTFTSPARMHLRDVQEIEWVEGSFTGRAGRFRIGFRQPIETADSVEAVLGGRFAIADRPTRLGQ